MGFFGKLFEKKECAFCGDEIGMLGNRKLEDGNMCKACAKKLSAWFDDRRHSTVAQIGEQLAYREENRAKVSAFRATRSFGETKKLLIDENAGAFMITSADTAAEMDEENPDVISLTDVTGCTFSIDDRYRELMQTDKEGKKVPYVPARYEYSYDFYICVNVNNPYFDDMKFRLNRNTLDIVTQQPQRFVGGGAIGKALRMYDPELSVEYRQYKQMGEEAKDFLLKVREEPRQAEPAAAPQGPVTCPCCNAVAMPDKNGCCEYCGSALNG